ncbi:hypothetical protein Sango_1776100 [Sesamum angolense]|uniref:Uncharacterized protein n=1 Tax=Sesamum angolense TaxID=2727404 RepID=A0AAE1WGN9_9LAMI|nr:hypothetical protein Sango_1776100 [Sesamum angolense]
MTEAEKMEELKRAYAEMILNTAKEAAARVMAAEIGARRLEQDLVSTKEEGARMLLRLKQIIHVKTKEAENSLLSQQRRLYELESQLNEAEGIILDLRAELNQAQERLDEAKRHKLPSRRQNENEEMRNMTPKGTYNSYELLASSAYSGPECITDRAKFHEGFPVGDESNPSNSSTNVEIVHASVLEEKPQHGKDEPISVVRRSCRKRNVDFWDDVITACGLRSSYQIKKPSQAFSYLSCYSPSKVKSCVKSGEDQFQAEDETQIKESLDLPESSKELKSTEVLPQNMELIDVLVKQDELAATFELTSSSRVDCIVEGGTATKASNASHANAKNLINIHSAGNGRRNP